MNPKVVSAGGLVVRRCPEGWETVLVGSGTPKVWRIPKGMLEGGETVEHAATREVLEETGVAGAIVELIGTAGWTYTYDNRDWDETVYFYLMKFVAGDVTGHDEEFETAEWIGLEEAARSLYYRNEADIAEKALSLLRRRAGEL